MAIPYTFKAGEIARAEHINSNFAHIMSLLGSLSSTGKLVPPGEIAMGPRKAAILSAAHDSTDSRSFYQISWNADWEIITGAWQFKRVINSKPAAAMRIGGFLGFEVRGTAAITGNLNSQLTQRLRLWWTTSNTYLSLAEGTRITNYMSATETPERERLTFTLLSTPKVIYNSVKLNKGTTTISAFNWVPRHARAIEVRVGVVTDVGSNVFLYAYQARDPRQINKLFGVTCVGHSFVASGKRYGYHAATTGMVPLGRGSHNGRFMLERTNTFTRVYLSIIGFYT